MQFLILLAIFVSVLPDLPSGLVKDPVWSVTGTWGSVLSLGILIWSAGVFFPQLWSRRGMAPSLWWYRLIRGLFYIGTVAAQLLSLAVFNWNNTLRQSWGLGDWIVIDELLAMSPLVFSLVALWWGIYPAEKTLHYHLGHSGSAPFWTRSGYVFFQMRTHAALLFAPLLLYVAMQELGLMIELKASPGNDKSVEYSLAISILAVITVLVFLPWILVRLWDTEPLPPGELRQLLSETAKRLGFRYTDFRVWHTQQNIANALVTGILPWPRYIVFSDGLLNALSPAELVAVLGHEIGHIRRGHLPLYIGLCILAVTSGVQLLTWRWPGQEQYFLAVLFRLPSQLPDWMQWVEFAGGAAVLWSYVWLVFGYVSRQCEREADVYGCLAASTITEPISVPEDLEMKKRQTKALTPEGIRTFIRALEKVADVNGLSRRQWSWRHGSITRRIAYLEKLEQRAERGHFWPRWLWLPSWTILAILGLSVLGLHYIGTGIL
ncbi:MAG: M48 family metallopeptidase [Gemmatales bacterium]|nr:M48 family metallopeptidase [Gemmatales bacterium]